MTKKLNKKGTSLVELIAVIVIMGVIAAIAVPTTMTVVGRQRKNAAVKSAEAIISQLETRASEALGDSDGTVKSVKTGLRSLQGTQTTIFMWIDTNISTDWGTYDFFDAADEGTDLEEDVPGIKNLETKLTAGSFIVTFNGGSTFTYELDDVEISGYFVYFDDDGKLVASKTEPTEDAGE